MEKQLLSALEFTDKLRAAASGADAQRPGVSALEQLCGQLARAGQELEQERQPIDALIAHHGRAVKLRNHQPEPQKKPTRYYGPRFQYRQFQAGA